MQQRVLNQRFSNKYPEKAASVLSRAHEVSAIALHQLRIDLIHQITY